MGTNQVWLQYSLKEETPWCTCKTFFSEFSLMVNMHTDIWGRPFKMWHLGNQFTRGGVLKPAFWHNICEKLEICRLWFTHLTESCTVLSRLRHNVICSGDFNFEETSARQVVVKSSKCGECKQVSRIVFSIWLWMGTLLPLRNVSNVTRVEKVLYTILT